MLVKVGQRWQRKSDSARGWISWVSKSGKSVQIKRDSYLLARIRTSTLLRDWERVGPLVYELAA